MGRWVLEMQGVPPLANRVLSLTLRRRMQQKKAWRDGVCYLAKEQRIPALSSPTVIYTRHSSKEPDYDGLVFSGKPLIDGLVLAGVLADDAPKHLRPLYRWRFTPPGREHTTICIDGVEAEGAA